MLGDEEEGEGRKGVERILERESEGQGIFRKWKGRGGA